MALNTERGKIAHLLRRATFGASAAEIDAATRAGLPATIDRLLSAATDADEAEAAVPRDAFDFTRVADCIRYWTQRMLVTRPGFQEKLTFFWHGHLTSAVRKTGGNPQYMIAQIDTYRRLALGSFRDLVLASAKDPAMILWLDNIQNRRGRPNENYARELMELFTMGIGNYSEQDVREAARAFTGWFQRDGQFLFVPNQHDTGSKTVLGYTGNWDGGDVVDIVVRHPATSSHIARKLWSFFAYPNPEPEVTGAIAGVFMQSGFNIRETMRAIFSHPAFYSDRAYHALIKSPLEFGAGFLRSFEARADSNLLTVALPAMGQTPLNPPDVSGWPGGEDWISTTMLITRYNFVNGVLRLGPDQRAYVDVAGLLRARGLTTRDQILEFFIDLMVDGDLAPEKKNVLRDYLVARDDGGAGGFTLDERTINNKVRGLIYLLASTPEYQLN